MGIYTDNSQVMNTVQTIPTKLNDIVSSIIGKASELLNAPTAEQIQRIDWSSITAILGTISIILILTIVFLISLYILKSVGLYVMAKKEGKNFAWLAFVPFVTVNSGLVQGLFTFYKITLLELDIRVYRRKC